MGLGQVPVCTSGSLLHVFSECLLVVPRCSKVPILWESQVAVFHALRSSAWTCRKSRGLALGYAMAEGYLKLSMGSPRISQQDWAPKGTQDPDQGFPPFILSIRPAQGHRKSDARSSMVDLCMAQRPTGCTEWPGIR